MTAGRMTLLLSGLRKNQLNIFFVFTYGASLNTILLLELGFSVRLVVFQSIRNARGRIKGVIIYTVF